MIGLPKTIALPTVAEAPAGEVYARLTATRQRVRYWRDRHGFPPSYGHRIEIAPVAAWLANQGITVEWV